MGKITNAGLSTTHVDLDEKHDLPQLLNSLQYIF